jgi:methylated-DNA-protein-cysteine methyltransferase-like protein
MSDVYNEIYKIVQSIPKGRVLTYGVISHMIGGRMSAQGVGWALKALGSAKRIQTAKKSRTVVYNSVTVPWQRVVNAQGGTSTHKVGLPPDLQKQMLEAEGIEFNDEGKLDLDEYLWREGLNKDWKRS